MCFPEWSEALETVLALFRIFVVPAGYTFGTLHLPVSPATSETVFCLSHSDHSRSCFCAGPTPSTSPSHGCGPSLVSSPAALSFCVPPSSTASLINHNRLSHRPPPQVSSMSCCHPGLSPLSPKYPIMIPTPTSVCMPFYLDPATWIALQFPLSLVTV